MTDQVFSLKTNIILSVVVCTYNRARLLEVCLKSLVSQTLSPELYEVIIVDNNSNDETKIVAQNFCSQHPNFRAVTECNQGLSHARNRGWLEANGEYIAYIDDDAKAFPDWCEQIVSFIKRQPDIKVFGGPYYPFTLKPLPHWFPPEYGKSEMSCVERELSIGREWISGSNMIYHKSIFTHEITFNVKLGMNGGRVSYGEETRLLLYLAEKGYSVYYVPLIKVYHLIADYKMSLVWLLKSQYACGKDSNRIFSSKISVFRYLVRLIKGLIKSGKLFINYRREPFKRRMYYSFREFTYTLGGFVDKLI